MNMYVYIFCKLYTGSMPHTKSIFCFCTIFVQNYIHLHVHVVTEFYFFNPSVGKGYSNLFVCVCMSMCVLPRRSRNLGECFILLLFEPLLERT